MTIQTYEWAVRCEGALVTAAARENITFALISGPEHLTRAVQRASTLATPVTLFGPGSPPVLADLRNPMVNPLGVLAALLCAQPGRAELVAAPALVLAELRTAAQSHVAEVADVSR